jgi:Transcription factor WhiB
MYEWMDSALCTQVGPDPFDMRKNEAALRICHSCKVAEQCRKFMTVPIESRNHDSTIFAGTTPTDRARMRGELS